MNRNHANWIGHTLRRKCLLKQVIEGKIEGWIEVTGRLERRREQLLDDFKKKRRYRELKQEALYHILWRTRFGGGYAPVVRQTNDRTKVINGHLRDKNCARFALREWVWQ
jgi:hypothetical protein